MLHIKVELTSSNNVKAYQYTTERSTVGIAMGYDLDSREIEVRFRAGAGYFSPKSRPALSNAAPAIYFSGALRKHFI
jgi:hypothetical protein